MEYRILEIYDKVKRSIGTDDIVGGLKYLKELSNLIGKETHNHEILMIESNYNDLKKSEIRNTVNQEFSSIGKSKIRHNILRLAEMIIESNDSLLNDNETFNPIKEIESDLNPIKINTPIGSFYDNKNGTATDTTNRLMWMKAPWGMSWNGEKFSGNPKKLNWNEATKLFGRGSKVRGWVKNGSRMGVLKPEFMDVSSILKGYSYGTQSESFARFHNWRLPTCIEFHKSLCFDVSLFDNWKSKYGTDTDERHELLEKLGLGVNYEYELKFWTANERELDGFLYRFGATSGIAWRVNLRNDGQILDSEKFHKYNILLVRDVL